MYVVEAKQKSVLDAVGDLVCGISVNEWREKVSSLIDTVLTCEEIDVKQDICDLRDIDRFFKALSDSNIDGYADTKPSEYNRIYFGGLLEAFSDTFGKQDIWKLINSIKAINRVVIEHGGDRNLTFAMSLITNYFLMIAQLLSQYNIKPEE